MQEVKIYTASPSDLSPPVQSESFCVDMVLASDYASLASRYAALAAENAALNKFIAASCFVQAGEELAWYPAIDHAPETTATDAFLAEVRAQGADELAELYFTLAAHEANRYIADSWRESARFAKDYAVQIRKGAAQ